MLKIHTDFAALRRANLTPAPNANTENKAAEIRPARVAIEGADEESASLFDVADLAETRRAIADENRSSSTSQIRDLETAQKTASSLRQMITDNQQEALASHDGLSVDRIRTLLE